MEIKIDASIRSAMPGLRLIGFLADVKVEQEYPELTGKIEAETAELAARLSMEDIAQIPAIAATRAAYKSLGKDPSRYRPSAEALLRRVVSGKGLYRINNVVDALNLISVTTGYSIGGYDADRIQGDVSLVCGASEIPYEAIGRGMLNVENLPMLKDDTGYFGCPTSDSLRTMVSDKTTRFLMVFFVFGKDDFTAIRQMTEDYLRKYAFSKEIAVFLTE